MKTIDSLDEFYDELGKLFLGLSDDCVACQYPDCVGLIWLLEEEVEGLYELGVPLIEVNHGPAFLHSFSEDQNGKLELDVRYPPCKQLYLDKGVRRCRIYENRPFNCRIYPLGLERIREGKVVWALHLDCLYSEKKSRQGQLKQLKLAINSLIDRLNPLLTESIVEAYLKADAVTCFPFGENKYSIVKEVRT